MLLPLHCSSLFAVYPIAMHSAIAEWDEGEPIVSLGQVREGMT